MGSSDLMVGEAVLPRTMREELKNPARKTNGTHAPADGRPQNVASESGEMTVALLERRLAALEQTVGDIADIVEHHEITLRAREDALDSVVQSVLALRTHIAQSEKKHASETAELCAALAEASARLNGLEAAKAAAPSAAEPPIVSVKEAEPPAATQVPTTAKASARGVKDGTGPAYLSAAREAANSGTGFWDKSASSQSSPRRFGRTQVAIFGCAAPLMILATAAFVLNHHTVTAEPVPTPSVFVPTALSALPPAPQVIMGPPLDPTASELASTLSLAMLQEKAKTGDALAERDIGLKYLAGDSIAANDAEAARWLLRASYRGEASAEYWLGTLYSRGHGVPADPAQANHWYGASAKQGNRYAMHRLGIANFEGLGMQSNPEEAAHWFSQAAQLGLVDSQFDLAVLYERGLGVTQSLPDAYKWYAVAAAHGDKEAAERAQVLAKALKPAELAEATRASQEFKPGTSVEDNATSAAPKE